MRYVSGLTQEDTAERLRLSVRHVQRVQAEAIHMLALHLWQRRPLAPDPGDEPQAADWRSQTNLELATLSQEAPNPVADIGRTLEGILEMSDLLASTHSIRLEIGSVQPDLLAPVHPSVIRQTLISIIWRLALHTTSDKLAVFASLEDGQVKITITGRIGPGHALADSDLIGDIVTPPETSLEVHRKGSRVFVQVRTPSASERVVAVVEDNVDMVHFYRRCTAGTTYRIVHIVPDERQFADVIQAASPDVVVLDVMLPTTDGWQLLARLRECPETKSIPVIVISVVREESLASALGATLFLSKPVQPRRFVQTLDQVLHRAPA